MSGIESSPKVASVGSPSTNYDVTLDLNDSGRDTPLVGAMLALENPMGEGSELALGTVTEVTTRNRWHEDSAFRGAARTDGRIAGLSGESGDTRTATIRLQAAWSRQAKGEPWKASGPSLRMSPATGAPVVLVEDNLVRDLTAETEDLHYMGEMAGTRGVRLPFSIPDFSGPAGAWSSAVFGISGAGKTAVSSFYLATQMRHERMGIVIVDPQGQWAAEQGMVFSVQGFASELGRDVRVHRISTDLRLAKDAPLLTDLLKHTHLVVELGLKSEATQDIVWYEIAKALRLREDWTADDSGDLLRYLLDYLRSEETAERVYTTPDNRRAFINRVEGVLNDPSGFQNALHQFAPIHNLFQQVNPSGGIRHDLWATLAAVFDRPKGEPAPLLILDMSSAPLPGMDEEVSEAARVAGEILERDTVKAAVLRNLFRTLKSASEDKFRAGDNLNTLIVLDEAWRYAAPPAKSDEDEIASLSKDLAGYARDTRKFGIGWLYISQSTRSINYDIWDQMTVRFFGYGLSGADLDKMGEIVDDRSALRLYRTFGNPRSTGRYPFLVTGPVSPLAANATPLTLHVYTDFDEFRADNSAWIEAIRQRLGLPLVSGLPSAPVGSAAGPKKRPRGRVRDARVAILDSNREARANRQAVGVKDAAGFADPLAGLDDEVPF